MNKADIKTYDEVNGPWWMYAQDVDQWGIIPYEEPAKIASNLLDTRRLRDSWYIGFSLASHLTNAAITMTLCSAIFAIDQNLGKQSARVAVISQIIASLLREESKTFYRKSAGRVDYAWYAASRIGKNHQYGLIHAIWGGVKNGLKRNAFCYAASHLATIGCLAVHSGAFIVGLFKDYDKIVDPCYYATLKSEKAFKRAKRIFVRHRSSGDNPNRDVQALAKRAIGNKWVNCG